MSKNNKPKHFLILKIIGAILILLAIAGFVLTFNNFDNFENNYCMIGSFMTIFGLMLGIPCLAKGFSPEITKMNTKSAKYIQQETKDDVKDIINTTTEITKDAITKTTSAIKKGLQDVKFCKHCGAQIDADSKFCSVCGKEL